MEFSPRAIALIVTSFLNLVLVAFLLWKYRKRRIARILAATIFFMAGYSWLSAGVASAKTAETAMLWLTIFSPAAYFLIATLYHFCMLFSRMESRYTRAYLRFAYGMVAFLTIARVTGLDHGSVQYRSPAEGWFPTATPFYKMVYGPFLLVTVLSGLILVIRKMFKTEVRAERNKLWFLFLAVGAMLLFDTANLVPSIAFVATLAPVALTGILSYAITRHRLFDLSLAVKKGAFAMALAFGAVVAAGALVLKLQEQVVIRQTGFNTFALVSTALLLSIAILPLWNLAYRAANRLLGIRVLTLEQRLLEYSTLLAKHLRVPEYLAAVLEKLGADTGISRSAILLKDRAGSSYASAGAYPAHFEERGTLKAGSLLAREMDRLPRVLDTEELLSAFDEDEIDGLDGPARRALVEEMAAFKSQVALPILMDGKADGLLLLGSKVSDAIFSQRELDFLQALCAQVAAAMENSRLQEQVQQADRLSTLGTLSASLAHELRNPLTSISTFVQMLPSRHADDSFMEKFQRVVGGEMSKLQKLTDQLLAFARPASQSRGSVELRGLAERVRQLLKYQFSKKGVALELALGDKDVLVTGNETELSQVLINLLLNAMQATPHSGKVRLLLEASGGEARLLVEDNGSGMSSQQLSRIFDPFFTTKEDGTGLGLPTCQRVAEQHQGRIAVESREGEGSRFTLCLPLQSSFSSIAA